MSRLPMVLQGYLFTRVLSTRQFIAERSEGFDDFQAMVEKYTPEYVAEICGIDACDLIAAAKLYGEAGAAAIVYCLGVTEHTSGTEGVMALSNLAMITGNFGKPGTGVTVRRRTTCRAACDMGATPAISLATRSSPMPK